VTFLLIALPKQVREVNILSKPLILAEIPAIPVAARSKVYKVLNIRNIAIQVSNHAPPVLYVRTLLCHICRDIAGGGLSPFHTALLHPKAYTFFQINSSPEFITWKLKKAIYVSAYRGKFQPRTGHEGPEEEQKNSSTLSLTSELEGVSGQRQAPVVLPLGKTRYPLHRRLSGPQGWSGRVWKNRPLWDSILGSSSP